MTENDTLAQVVPIHPDRDLHDEDAPVTSGDRSASIARCRHKHIRLDEDAHRAYCQGCDVEVDPFAFLLTLAHEWERYSRHRQEAERKATSAHTRLEEIRRLERNARARVKKLDPSIVLPKKPYESGWI